MEDFDIDFADVHGLWLLYNRINQLKDGVSGIQMTAGGEAFRTALIFYKKVATSHGIIGAKALYEELKKRFPKPEKAKLKHKILTSEAQSLVFYTNILALEVKFLACGVKILASETKNLTL